MNTKNKYIQPEVEIIEMEVESSIMTGSKVGVSGDEITNNDGALRSRKRFWGEEE